MVKVTANASARIWALLINVLFVPVYIRYLGVEAYGLVGFFATVQGVLSLFDFGWSTTLSKELAHDGQRAEARPRLRDLLRSFEALYLLIGVALGLSVVVGAPVISRSWLHAKNLELDSVTTAVRLLGLSISAQWPVRLYSGGLIGLQRQELNAMLLSITRTVQAVGAICVLALVAPTIEAFFVWQFVASVITVILLRAALWRHLTCHESRPRFRLALVHANWRFSAGITGISAFGLMFTVGDKLVVSALLPLKTLGYYTLASMLASAVAFLALPVYNAIFPRFAQLVASRDDVQLSQLYHRASQFLAATVAPVVVLFVLYPEQLVWLWTGDPEIAWQLRWVLPILVLGSALNAVDHAPYALQLANGWTRLQFTATAIAATVLSPLLVLLTWLYGAVGASVIWLLLNSISVFVVVPIMHKRLLVGEKWAWYFKDMAPPFLTTVLLGIAARLWLPQSLGRLQLAMTIFTLGMAMLLAAFLVSTELRARIFGELGRRWFPVRGVED